MRRSRSFNQRGFFLAPEIIQSIDNMMNKSVPIISIHRLACQGESDALAELIPHCAKLPIGTVLYLVQNTGDKERTPIF